MTALSVVALLSVVNGATVSSTPPAPEHVIQITIFPAHGWLIDFYPDGQAHAQWGSLPGDGASVSKGTVRFDALLAAIQRLRVNVKIDDGTQVAILQEGETSVTGFYVSDDTLFRYLLASFSDKWTQDAEGTRFHELLKKHPIYPPR